MSKEDLKEQEAKQAEESKIEEQEEASATDNSTESEEAVEEQEELSPEEQFQIELQEAKDKYLRLYSEFDNYRKRSSKERLELIKTASEDVMVEMLSILDDFERAGRSFKEEKTDKKAIVEGVELIADKFSKILAKKGLKKMEVEPGDEFDADIHEAITKIPAPEEKLKGKIVDTVENGYYLNDKVIRFAKVVIGE